MSKVGNRRSTSKHVDLARDGQAIKAEYFQTDQWAIEAILECEILTRAVIDPCCGDGRMAEAAVRHGYSTIASDLYDWGYGEVGHNFLDPDYIFAEDVEGATVFINPAFSIACQFVDRARELGARKIVCFQRSVWRESSKRRAWWAAHPPSRIYQCGDRAECWYGTIPEAERGGGANQPHSWYIWERGNPPGTLLGTIWRPKP